LSTPGTNAAPVTLKAKLSQLIARLTPTERQRVFLLTILIGAICGLVAVSFHMGIQFLEEHWIDKGVAMTGGMQALWMIASPTIGGLIAGLVLVYFPNAAGSGIPQVKAEYVLHGGRIPLRDSIAKYFLSMVQIGSGGSLGREGPTVQICSGVASTVARFANISPKSKRRLTAVGVAAGIAAAFNAPMAAVTFTVEEIVGDLDQTLLSGVIVAAAIAAIVERAILGVNPVLAVKQQYQLEHADSLILYAVLGICAALVSLLFTESLLNLRLAFRKLPLPNWVKPRIGGAITGLIALLVLRSVHSTGITGGGYSVLSNSLSSGIAVRVMLVLCICKIVATVFSYSSGGAGGIFAPALFIGGMLGGAFGYLDYSVFHHHLNSVGAFALVGMGAVFAGIIRAPITSVLIIFEMTGSYGLILPLMLANMIAYGLARHYRHLQVYEALLVQDGIEIPHRPGEQTGMFPASG
jgi:CIC family chloride channel protein